MDCQNFESDGLYVWSLLYITHSSTFQALMVIAAVTVSLHSFLFLAFSLQLFNIDLNSLIFCVVYPMALSLPSHVYRWDWSDDFFIFLRNSSIAVYYLSQQGVLCTNWISLLVLNLQTPCYVTYTLYVVHAAKYS